MINMTETKSKWLRDLLVIPLIVAIVVAIFTYGFPKLIEKGKELSYTIDGPNAYLNQQAIGNLSIAVNGVTTAKLFTYKVRLWNSGGVPLKDIPVRLVFGEPKSGFRMLGVTHSTTPKYEFAKIQEVGNDSTSTRYVYELLNPGNQDVITLVTNEDPILEFYSNVEGLRVKRIEPQEPKGWLDILSLATTVVAAFASILSILLKTLFARKTKN
jgi:hypothetical protein